MVEISRMHKTGRPVLVGTTSVEQSDALSAQLQEAGIPHEVKSFTFLENLHQSTNRLLYEMERTCYSITLFNSTEFSNLKPISYYTSVLIF